MSKELIAATVKELAQWPGCTMREETPGKHGKLVLGFNDQSRLCVMSMTPSDSRAVPNHLAIVRKLLRDMGASKAPVIVGKPQADRPERPFIPATTKPFVELETIMSDTKKIDAILTGIANLKYGEMLEFASLLSDAAVSNNLRRNRPQEWATMLHAVSEKAA